MKKLEIIKKIIILILLAEYLIITSMITNRLIEYKDKINNMESRIVELERGVK